MKDNKPEPQLKDKIKELQKASNEFIERRPYDDKCINDGNFNYIHQDRVHDLIENAFKKGALLGSQLTVEKAKEKVNRLSDYSYEVSEEQYSLVRSGEVLKAIEESKI
jgi:hypothetical protein